MSKKPIVGIVILNYNKSEYTVNCVSSILQYENIEKISIVVVDNDSPDQIQKAILEKQLPSSVTLILNPVNDGYAAGNNVGAKHLINEFGVDYIFVLNNDSVFTSPIIDKLIDTIADSSDMAAVSPLVLKQSNLASWPNVVQVRKLVKPLDIIICNTSIISKFFRRKVRSYLYKDLMPYEHKVYKVDSINGAAFLIKAPVLVGLGYLDESTFLYYEELILGFQLKQKQLSCALNASLQIMHYQGVSTNADDSSFPYAMFKHHLKSLNLLLVKYYKVAGPIVVIFSAYRYSEYLLKSLYLWLKKKF